MKKERFPVTSLHGQIAFHNIVRTIHESSATSRNKRVTHVSTSFFKPRGQKSALQFALSFTLKLWNDLTKKKNDLAWNAIALSK